MRYRKPPLERLPSRELRWNHRAAAAAAGLSALALSGCSAAAPDRDPPPSDAECASIAVGANAKVACRWMQDPNHWYNDITISDQDIHRITGE